VRKVFCSGLIGPIAALPRPAPVPGPGPFEMPGRAVPAGHTRRPIKPPAERQTMLGAYRRQLQQFAGQSTKVLLPAAPGAAKWLRRA